MEKLKENPLSGSEMLKFNPDARLINYRDLYEYNNILDAFGHSHKIILFYPTSANNRGHWTGLLMKEKNIYFFDPYALYPDEETTFSASNIRKQNGLNYHYLLKLLHSASNNGYTIYRNPYRLQSPLSQTCGRYVSLFLKEELTPTDFYEKYFKYNGKKPDDIIIKKII